jgi:hypothetical protein
MSKYRFQFFIDELEDQLHQKMRCIRSREYALILLESQKNTLNSDLGLVRSKLADLGSPKIMADWEKPQPRASAFLMASKHFGFKKQISEIETAIGELDQAIRSKLLELESLQMEMTQIILEKHRYFAHKEAEESARKIRIAARDSNEMDETCSLVHQANRRGGGDGRR